MVFCFARLEPHVRRLIPVALALACLQAGCMLISQAQRDDDEEWHGTWGSEDGTGGKDDARVRKDAERQPGPDVAPGARPQPDPAPQPVVARREPAPQPVPAVEHPAAAEPGPRSRPKPKRRPKRKPKPKRRPEPVPEPLPPPPEVAPELNMPKVEEPPDPNAPLLEEPPEPAPTPAARPQPNATQSPPARPGAEKPAPRPTPAPAQTDPPVRVPEPQPVDSEPNIYVGVDGGILVQRGGRIEPAAGLELGWNLGKLLGWSGLYLEADMDIFIGESPLGSEYVMLDTGLGFTGHFSLGPVNLLVGLEFVLRDMFITKQGATTTGGDPQMGFGAGAGLGLAVPLTDWLDVHLGADGRYARQPLTNRFEFTAVVSGGLGFSF